MRRRSMLANINDQLCAQQWKRIITQRNTFNECLYEMSNDTTWTTESTRVRTFLKKLCWFVGVPPLQMYNTSVVVLWIMLIIGQATMLLSTTHEIYQGCTDMQVSINNIMLSFSSLMAISKSGSYRFYAKNFIIIFRSFESDYLAADGKLQRSIMRTHSLTAEKICNNLLFVPLFSCAMIFTHPFIAHFMSGKVNATENAFPIELPVTLDCTFVPTSAKDYVISYMLEILPFCAVCAGNNCGDCVFIILACHICGQIKILGHEFAQLGANGESTRKRCSLLIKRHKHLLLLADNFITMNNIILVVQLASGCLLICILGFQVILALQDNDYAMITQVVVIFSFFPIQLYAYCYIGDYLKCQMEEIGYGAYECNWYNLSTDVHRDLIFVMIRSQKPVQLNAGGYFPINFETYTTIWKTSLSYLSVLRVVLDE